MAPLQWVPAHGYQGSAVGMERTSGCRQLAQIADRPIYHRAKQVRNIPIAA